MREITWHPIETLQPDPLAEDVWMYSDASDKFGIGYRILGRKLSDGTRPVLTVCTDAVGDEFEPTHWAVPVGPAKNPA